jgi:hypothetical protein
MKFLKNEKLLERTRIYTIQSQIMKLGLHISHLPLSANEPMVFCAYSDRGAQEINKWTGPGPSGKI